MLDISRSLLATTALLATALVSACGSGAGPDSPTSTPSPVGDPPTANVYILPGAIELGGFAFGDHPLVIYKGERMRLRNFDSVAHSLVPDTPSLPEFVATGTLQPGDERSFLMSTIGRTAFHCVDHPQMTGTLIVQQR